MRFYTNVQLIGNQFLVRGVENGRDMHIEMNSFPHYLLNQKRKQNTKH